MKKVPVLFREKNECCGCGVCLAVCPKNAIAMEIDEEGFSYPRIDAEKCIRCGKCSAVCVFKYDMKRKERSNEN